MVKIVALLGSSDGDNSNALGVQAALSAQYEAAGVEVDDELTAEEIAGNFSPNERYILIAAGETMLDPLIGYKRPNVLTAWSGHEPPQEFMAKAKALDSVHLPDYTVSPQMRRTLGGKLVTTPHGVPHSLSEEMCLLDFTAALAMRGPQSVPDAQRYCVIVLGGDDKERKFTPQEAKELGLHEGQWAKDNGATLLATNGPRTGGRENHKPGMDIDPVSRAFLEGVAQSGIPHNQVAFYPYLDDDKPSMFTALLGAVSIKPGSLALIPGDSSSMLTQAVDILPKGTIEAYSTSAMNSNHHAQVARLSEMGLVNLWKKAPVEPGRKPPKAAESVAAHVASRAAECRFPSPQQAGRRRAG